jgi:type IV secretory pathway component VirB8
VPYRNQSPLDVARQLAELQMELNRSKQTLLAVRLALVFFVFIIAIQAISNCCLVRLKESPTCPEKTEKAPGSS